MKAKKALKRLRKAEALLSNVIDQFSGTKDGLGELLGSAKDAVLRATKRVDAQESNKSTKKPPSRAKTAQRGHLSAEGRKKISLAAKRRSAAAKRKGMNAVTGRRLSKTA